MKKVAVIIPAYNEEKAIKSVIDRVNSLTFKLECCQVSEEIILDAIVVNDCSTDKTLEIAKNSKCCVLDLPVNLGIGGAVQTGFKFAFENNYDCAIQCDGDGQHPPEEIPKLIQAILTTDNDVIIGSRFLEKSGFQSSFWRRAGIKYLKLLIKLFCKITITDCTSGFRIINRKALSIVNEYYPDEYPEPESIILYSLNNLKIAEIPIKMSIRLGGKSSIRAFTTIYYMIKVSIAIFYTFISLYRNRSVSGVVGRKKKYAQEKVRK